MTGPAGKSIYDDPGGFIDIRRRENQHSVVTARCRYHDGDCYHPSRVRTVEPEHLERAFQWLLARKTALRALDALHLACAEAATLVTQDATMRSAAEYHGLRVYELSEA